MAGDTKRESFLDRQDLSCIYYDENVSMGQVTDYV